MTPSPFCQLDCNLPAYILVGGKSSRFGRDKARVEVEGRANVVSLAEPLKSRCRSVTLVAQRTEDYADLGIFTISDLEANAGPLAGVMTALENLRLQTNPPRDSIDGLPYAHASCWILSCDLLVRDWAWMDRLTAVHSPESLVTAYRDATFRPFPAIYTLPMLSVVKQVWDAGQRSMRSALAAAEPRVHWVQPDGLEMPHSFNTPDEFQQAVDELDK